jgi:hypothetical protein
LSREPRGPANTEEASARTERTVEVEKCMLLDY